ncbi:MAG: GNAT family N-acetyltransferase [Ignavibacteriales bacterium]|nr:GNAT family N-acetyltransferase [Ignavibacteriales bacterium]
MNTPPHSSHEIRIRHEFKSGDVGRLIELHGLLYSQEYGFDHTFEVYVAKPLADFVLHHTERERIWLVDSDGILMGSLAIVRHNETEAQLRWYLLHPSLRGKGLGTRLVEESIAFCHERGYKRVFLWTVSSLLAAAQVYRKTGFQLVEENTHEIWGCMLTEQRYDLELYYRTSC